MFPPELMIRREAFTYSIVRQQRTGNNPHTDEISVVVWNNKQTLREF